MDATPSRSGSWAVNLTAVTHSISMVFAGPMSTFLRPLTELDPWLKNVTQMVGNGDEFQKDGDEDGCGQSSRAFWAGAASDTEAFAVGDPIATGEPEPVLLHYWDGAWAPIDLLQLDRSPRAFSRFGDLRTMCTSWVSWRHPPLRRIMAQEFVSCS